MTEEKKLGLNRFAFIIKSMRKDGNLSRQKLAQLAEVDPVELDQLERGELVPSAETKQKLESVFGFTYYPKPHRQVIVEVGQWKKKIDEGIANLIREMWIAGIDTSMSCQQNVFGRVWITFPDTDNLKTFLDIVGEVFDDEPTALYRRMQPAHGDHHGPIANWSYRLEVFDFSRMGGGDSPDDPPDFNVEVHLEFPFYDVPAILKMLKAHNRRLRRTG